MSSHGLAIMARATAENGFLGYALVEKGDDGQLVYRYFDRYPVLFSAVSNFLFDWDSVPLGERILRMRQFFNVIYLATTAVCYLLVRRLTGRPWGALAVALLASSGHYLVIYKDMIHYDQPALLGFMLLLLMIADRELRRRSRLFFPIVLFAVLTGRGYASFAVLGVWGGIEVVRVVLERRPFRAFVRRIVTMDATKACCLALCACVAALAYNVYGESRITGAPVAKTSIIGSATRRLGASKSFNEGHAKSRSWGSFLRSQSRRVVVGLTPADLLSEKKVPAWSLALALIPIAALVAFERDRRLRLLWVLVATCGFAWCIPLRNLTAFHDYTAMYYLGFSLAFFAGLVRFLPRRWDIALAAMGTVVFAVSLWRVHPLTSGERSANQITRDFQRIRALLEPGQGVKVVGNYRDIVPHAPYALGFYLEEQPIVLGKAKQALSRSTPIKRWPRNLTPRNKQVFLLARPH